MNIRSFAGIQPVIALSAFVDKTAVVIGDVVIGENSSVWPMTVIRGDVNRIRIGNYSNIQDGSIIHVNHPGEFNPSGNDVQIGDNVTVGHKVVLHGCQIANQCLIGIGSIVMDGVSIESQVVLGAGSLVPPGKILAGGYLWLGSPAKKIRPLTGQELAFLDYSAKHYASLQTKHRD